VWSSVAAGAAGWTAGALAPLHAKDATISELIAILNINGQSTNDGSPEDLSAGRRSEPREHRHV
jgi:hypothetical protein